MELGLIVDDDTPELQLGQMRKSEFMALAGSVIYATAEEGLTGTGQSARDCIYLRFWLALYHGRDARTVERAVLRFAPEANVAVGAAGLVAPLAARVRKSVEVWARTGRVTGIPHAGLFSSIDGSRGFFPVPTTSDPLIVAALQESGGTDLGDGAGLRLQIGPGRPLEGGVRSRMESAFGADFSSVRVHTDPAALGLAHRFQARALTVGRDIVFGHGQYRPGTIVGDAILAHELAHVVQQRGGDQSTGADAQDEVPELERDADRSAADVLFSLWGTAKGSAMAAYARTGPALRTGLRVQRCKGGKEEAPPPATLTFSSFDFKAAYSGALTITDDPGRAAAIVRSPAYEPSGKVSARGGTDAEAAGYETGFIQTVLSSSRKGDYLTSVGAHYKYFEASLPGPTRDGNPASTAVEPWYDSNNADAFKKFTTTGTDLELKLWDAPGTGFPWQTADGTGTLTTSFNSDKFATWLIVRKKATGDITYLNWATWEVDWGATYDFAAKAGTSTGGGKFGSKGSGKGSETPVLVNPVANNAAVVRWI